MKFYLSKRESLVFTGTFVSAFMLVFGLLVIVITAIPILSSAIAKYEPYTPRLPLSEDRDDELIDISNNGKQMFPSLASLDPPAQQSNVFDNYLYIPSIGVAAPIVMSKTMRDADVQSALQDGVALYPNGVEPGRLGDAFIAGHSSGEPWRGPYRSVFVRIADLNTGNIIHIDYKGARYTFRVIKKEIITPTPDYHIVSDRPVPTITLMTCWPTWSSKQRILVQGELTSITQLTQRPTSTNLL